MKRTERVKKHQHMNDTNIKVCSCMLQYDLGGIWLVPAICYIHLELVSLFREKKVIVTKHILFASLVISWRNINMGKNNINQNSLVNKNPGIHKSIVKRNSSVKNKFLKCSNGIRQQIQITLYRSLFLLRNQMTFYLSMHIQFQFFFNVHCIFRILVNREG